MTDQLKQLAIRVRATTHRAAKLTAVAYGISLSAAVDRLLRLWVSDPSIIRTEPPEPPDDLTETLRRAFEEASPHSSED